METREKAIRFVERLTGNERSAEQIVDGIEEALQGAPRALENPEIQVLILKAKQLVEAVLKERK